MTIPEPQQHPAPEPTLHERLQAQTSPSHRGRRTAMLVGLMLAGLAVWYLSGGKTGSGTTYQTEQVTQGDLHVTVAASGTLAPTNVVTIGSELSGIVAHVDADINDPVKKGQLLAQLDTSKLTDTLTKSEAALTAAQAGVRQAEASVQESAATLARQQELARLSHNRLPSKTDMDAAIATHARAEADKASADAAVAQAAAALSSDRTNLEKASIRAPIDGVILSRSVEPGQTVAASLSAPTLFEIAEDLSRMELQVDVDEADVGQVHAGQTATFTVDAYPGRTYTAALTRVSYGATTTDNVVSYLTTLTVDNPDLSLRPGMTANAIISTDTRTGVLLVPNAALRYAPPARSTADDTTQKRSFISSLMPRPPATPKTVHSSEDDSAGQQANLWVLDNGAPKALRVTRGATDGTLTEVSGADLHPGLQVITSSRGAAK